MIDPTHRNSIRADRDAVLAEPPRNRHAEAADSLSAAASWRLSVALYRGRDNGAGAKRLARGYVQMARALRLEA